MKEEERRLGYLKSDHEAERNAARLLPVRLDVDSRQRADEILVRRRGVILHDYGMYGRSYKKRLLGDRSLPRINPAETLRSRRTTAHHGSGLAGGLSQGEERKYDQKRTVSSLVVLAKSDTVRHRQAISGENGDQ